MSTALRNRHLFDAFRDPHPMTPGWLGDAGTGAFVMQGPCGVPLRVLASSELGWDHVSVSTERRIPNWTEMEWVRRRFFRDDATVMQLHVPPAEHINCHPYVLHLWRPHVMEIPRPPGWMVGPPPEHAP